MQDGPKGKPTKPQLKIKADYSVAFRSEKLDSSEFILLALSYFEHSAKALPIGVEHQDQLNRIMKDIRTAHLDGQYDVAKMGISAVLKEFPQLTTPLMTEIIEAKKGHLRDNPDENNNRRYFETTLAAEMTKYIKESGIYESVGELIPILQELSRGQRSEKTFAAMTTVDNHQQASNILLKICQLNDFIEMGLKSQVPDYSRKDRSEKPKDRPVGSRNIGIMKSITPNFYDDLAANNLENRVVDRFKVDRNKERGFSASNANVPFVNSISGTTFTLVAILDKYMQKNINDPHLEEKVNNIIKAFTAIYVVNGFHSLGEMSLILNNPVIQKIFKDNNVKLDNQIPESVMDEVYQKAEFYTKVTTLRKGTQDQLKDHVKVIDPVSNIVSSDVTLVEKRLTAKELGTDVGKVVTFSTPQQLGRTYMEFPNEEAKLKAFESIKNAFGENSVRIAGRAKTIEFLTSNVITFIEVSTSNKIIGKEATGTRGLEPTLEALARPVPTVRPQLITHQLTGSTRVVQDATAKLNVALKEGTPTVFANKPGQQYIVFSDNEKMHAAVECITAIYGKGSCRVAGNPNTIEIYDKIQNHLATEKLFQNTDAPTTNTKTKPK